MLMTVWVTALGVRKHVIVRRDHVNYNRKQRGHRQTDNIAEVSSTAGIDG
jgi:hypothetical protein